MIQHAVDILKEQLSALEAEQAKLSARLKEVKANQKDIRAAVTQLTSEGGQTSNPKSIRSQETLSDLILAILSVSNHPLSPAEIAEQLTSNGRETAATTVSSTLARMKKAGDVIGGGREWSVPPDEGDVPPPPYDDYDPTEHNLRNAPCPAWGGDNDPPY
jgi:arginine repressor